MFRRITYLLAILAFVGCSPQPVQQNQPDRVASREDGDAAPPSVAHYEPTDIAVLASEERDILFKRVETFTVDQQAVVRKYRGEPVQWSAEVFDLHHDQDEACPLRLNVDVHKANGSFAISANAHFSADSRSLLACLRRGDRVTIVGLLQGASFGTLTFYACELIRAERDAKQIYPPPEEPEKAEGEKKP